MLYGQRRKCPFKRLSLMQKFDQNLFAAALCQLVNPFPLYGHISLARLIKNEGHKLYYDSICIIVSWGFIKSIMVNDQYAEIECRFLEESEMVLRKSYESDYIRCFVGKRHLWLRFWRAIALWSER